VWITFEGQFFFLLKLSIAGVQEWSGLTCLGPGGENETTQWGEEMGMKATAKLGWFL